jgi:hypothetical protein
MLYLEQEQERRVNTREKTRTSSSNGAYRSGHHRLTQYTARESRS